MSLLLLFAGGGPQAPVVIDYTVIDFHSRKRPGFESQARPIGEKETLTSRKRPAFVSKKRR